MMTNFNDFWAQKLTGCVRFWAQQLTLWARVDITEELRRLAISKSTLAERTMIFQEQFEFKIGPLTLYIVETSLPHCLKKDNDDIQYVNLDKSLNAIYFV